MSQTLVVSDQVYKKLTLEAARRGTSVNSLLRFVSEVVAPDESASESDRRRGRAIERLFAQFRDGSLDDAERSQLNRLIDREFDVATEHADRRMAARSKRRARLSNASKSP